MGLRTAHEAVDLEALAARIAPEADAWRGRGLGWRSDEEGAGSLIALDAYRDTPIETSSDPFVLDGQLLITRPLERRTALPDQSVIARLVAEGDEAWLAPRRAAARVVADPNPLGMPEASTVSLPTGPPPPSVVSPSDLSTAPPISLPTIRTQP